MSYIRNQIKNLLGSKIYSRALDYYNNGYVKHINDDDYPNIRAVVLGSGRRGYHVFINSEKRQFHCNCPYPDICKHIGAVLLEIEDGISHFYESNQLDSLPDFSQVVQQRTKLLQNSSDRVFELKHNALNNDTLFLDDILPKTDNPQPNGRFTFVLLIREDSIFGKYYLRSGLQYIKKDGSPGRIEEFNPKKLTVPLPENCKTLYALLLNRNEVPLTEVLDFIKPGSELPLRFQQNKNHVDLNIIRISHITITFKVRYVTYLRGSSVDSTDGTVVFTPIIHFNKKNSDDESVTIDQCIPSVHSYAAITESLNLYISNRCPKTTALLHALQSKKELYPSEINKISSYVAEHISKKVTVLFNKKEIRFLYTVPVPVLYIEGEAGRLTLSTFFRYGSREIEAGHESKLLEVIDNDSTELLLHIRDNEIEAAYIGTILKAIIKCEIHLEDIEAPATTPETFSINYPDAQSLLLELGSELALNGFEIRYKEKKIRPMSGGSKIAKRVNTGIDWFSIDVTYNDDEGNEHILTIDEELLKSGLIRHKDEYIPLSPEDIEQLRTISKNTQKEGDSYRLSRYNFALIEELHDQLSDNEKEKLDETIALYNRLRNFKRIKKYTLPKKFNAQLRDYQKEGYRWLMFLQEFGINGCLADDMGLGKTVQTLALFQKLKEIGMFRTSILVVPVSTMQNWLSEIERFCTGFSTLVHIGSNRSKEIDHILSYDIVITSYHTLARDLNVLQDIDFFYAVIDEAQAIKNAESQSFKAIRSLTALHRISLTGTPVENSCSDLYSQIEFLHPGLLGTKTSFRKNYLLPIEKHNDADSAEALRKTVFPFIMRRKKEDVAPDLPDKEEITYYVEMHPKQRKLYESFRKKAKGDLDKKIKQKGLRGSTMAILEAMLRLRQIALFPMLVDEKFDVVESAKFEVLKDLVEEIVQEDHKVLIFSQFVESLKIIRGYCDSMKWQYSYIDGSTKKRELQIKQFQEDEKIKVFLLSIKAGGVGINLTAADYVIIFDPWWNPAVESQAVDRSHRIGQKNKVIAYRLIVKNTIEEKMQQLQNKKKNLVDNLITEEKSFFKSLTKDDIDYILG
jgi:hypothetical protein